MASNQSLASDTPATSQDKAAWYDLMGRWRAVVQSFQSNYALVASPQSAALAATNPDLQARYNAVLADSHGVQLRIQQIDAALGDVAAWLSGAWDTIRGWWQSVSGNVSQLFGYSPLMAPGRALQLGELGFVWLIPLGVVAAAVAYVGGKALDLYQTHQQLQAVQTYIDRGYTPAQAAGVVAKASASTGGLFSGLADSLKWAVGGTAAVALIWFLLVKPQLGKNSHGQ